jgi:hypothetical protein
MTDSRKRKAPIPVQQRRYSWRDHFDTLAHNNITLYEWEVYARTRMIALMSLCKAHDETESEEVRKAASEPWRFREYPTHTGAKKHILQALGEQAVQREHSHQVIAMGYLALIARHNPEMRESLRVALVSLSKVAVAARRRRRRRQLGRRRAAPTLRIV